MARQPQVRASGYDRYVNYRSFSVAVAAFVIVLLVPLPETVQDVAVEFAAGDEHVVEFYCENLFGQRASDVKQGEIYAARVLEGCMRQGALDRSSVLKRNASQIRNMGIPTTERHFDEFRHLVETMDPEAFRTLMADAYRLRNTELTYEMLSTGEREEADRTARHIRVCLAMVAFVVLCFLTEAIPLPGVAFCIGLILVFSGIVSRRNVASMFWSDACWFIMGSLMFAVAFVKTGVDKRICLLIFRVLAKPSIGWITAVLILIISPTAAFISDHALAAIFLPIGLTLYNNSLGRGVGADRELVAMLMITIAMACNIGGFGSPSGGARNVIIMTYMEDMFGITIGYGQWILFGMPFVLIMMPLVWLLVNWRFKPKIKDLGPALDVLKTDIRNMGGWSRNQVVALVIFAVMLLGWITENNLIYELTGIRLGIGVIAVAGAVLYLLAGVVNWRDYQEKVDWGVVWLYAGAVVFGRVLDETGTAYWMARSIVGLLASMGLDSGPGLLGAGTVVTAGMTNLMADGPAAASVGPVALNMAAVSNPGTSLIPFMGLATACASSFAYLLVIGTPPNAIVYSSGYIRAKDFLRVGIPCLALSVLVLLFLSLVVWPLMGFDGIPNP